MHDEKTVDYIKKMIISSNQAQYWACFSYLDHDGEMCETVLVKCWNPSNGLHLNNVENVSS